jgi:hypothetical protein
MSRNSSLNSLRSCSRPCMALAVSAVRLHATLPTQSFRCADQFHTTPRIVPLYPLQCIVCLLIAGGGGGGGGGTPASPSRVLRSSLGSAQVFMLYVATHARAPHRANRRAGCLHHSSSYIAVSRAVGMVTVPVHVAVRVASLSLQLTEHPCCAHSHRTVIASLFCLEVVPRWHTTRRGRLSRRADFSTARRAWGGASGLFGTP